MKYVFLLYIFHQYQWKNYCYAGLVIKPWNYITDFLFEICTLPKVNK